MRLMYHEAHFFLFFSLKKKRAVCRSISAAAAQPPLSHILTYHTEETLPAAGLCVCVCVCSFRELSEVREIEKKWEHAEFKREVGRKKERQSGKRRVE